MERVETRVFVGRDVTDTVEFYERTTGDLRSTLPEDVVDRIISTLRMALVPYAEGAYNEDSGVRLPAAAWIVSASAAL